MVSSTIVTNVPADAGETQRTPVARPPRTLADAFALAVEQDLLAPMTLTGATVRDHARALLERPEWFLHDRP